MESRLRSVPELTKDAALQLGDLVRNEVRLARAEMLEGFKDIAFAGLRVALGVALASAAVTLALLALAYAIGQILPMWIGALVAAALGSLAAYYLIRSGQSAFTGLDVSLKRTTQHVSKDVSTIKETILQ